LSCGSTIYVEHALDPSVYLHFLMWKGDSTVLCTSETFPGGNGLGFQGNVQTHLRPTWINWRPLCSGCPPYPQPVCPYSRQPQSEQPQVPAPESSGALCPGGEGMPGGGHCGWHHAAGKGHIPASRARRWNGAREGHHQPCLFPAPWAAKQDQASTCRPRSVHQVPLLCHLMGSSGYSGQPWVIPETHTHLCAFLPFLPAPTEGPTSLTNLSCDTYFSEKLHFHCRKWKKAKMGKIMYQQKIHIVTCS
jgi:hypothetical protein